MNKRNLTVNYNKQCRSVQKKVADKIEESHVFYSIPSAKKILPELDKSITQMETLVDLCDTVKSKNKHLKNISNLRNSKQRLEDLINKKHDN